MLASVFAAIYSMMNYSILRSDYLIAITSLGDHNMTSGKLNLLEYLRVFDLCSSYKIVKNVRKTVAAI